MNVKQEGMRYAEMQPRELLLVMIERQENHLEAHKSLSAKVTRIEEKIIEDIENRVRLLENETNQRRGMYKFWLMVVGFASFCSVLLGIYNNLK
jgi:hypothetical protein